MNVTLCGISDEAGSSLASQLKAHRILGWKAIELRTIDGQDVSALSEEKFIRLERAITKRDYQVVSLASSIGNWARPASADFKEEIDEFRHLLYRAARLEARFIRVMSYSRGSLRDSDWRDLAVFKLQHLCDLARGSNVALLHENCAGWGSQSPRHSLQLLELINRDNIGLLFDIGNPIIKGQNALDWLQLVQPKIRHVHVKDAKLNRTVTYTLPGQGAGRVRECIARLISNGYSGAFSIEPHFFTVPHERRWTTSAAQLRSYVQYGEHFRNLLRSTCDDLGQQIHSSRIH